MKSALPIYLLSGMTPDDSIFDQLVPLLPNCTVVDWFEPYKNESLTSYAGRLAATIPTSDCYVGGVSFGGMVALEISRLIRPQGCFLISSIRDPQQLPPWLRVFRLMAGRHCPRILNTIGHMAAITPNRIRTQSTARLTKLAGEAGAWHRWATSAVLQWKPDGPLPTVGIYHIHGDADTTFPIRYTDPDVTVRNGGHDLPLTHPADLADAMLAVIDNAA